MKIGSVCLLLVAAIVGCAQPSTIVSKTYPPRDPTSVEILFGQPTRDYEQIAMISVHGVGAGSYANNTKIAIEKLKEEAGKIGADAVVLSGPPSQSTVATGTFQGGFSYAVAGPAGDSTIQAIAIKYR
jgi:hypothetical protein